MGFDVRRISDFRSYSNIQIHIGGGMMDAKPRRAKVKLIRTVTEIAIVLLDSDGNVEEVEDVHDTLDYDDCQVLSIISVISTRS